MGKVQRRAKGGGERKQRQQRRHAVMPKLNRAQQKFKREQLQSAEQQLDHRPVDVEDGTLDERKSGGEGTVYLSAYKRAQLTYERLQAEKRVQRERAREERERMRAERMLNTRWRQKKNQALQLRTAKGQPNLNAQIGILLQQIERRSAGGGDGRKMKKH